MSYIDQMTDEEIKAAEERWYAKREEVQAKIEKTLTLLRANKLKEAEKLRKEMAADTKRSRDTLKEIRRLMQTDRYAAEKLMVETDGLPPRLTEVHLAELDAEITQEE